MNLHSLLQARHASGQPVRVALIGAGKFGSMFLSQVPHVVGLEVPVIIDLDPERARDACRTIGWSAELIERTAFSVDGAKALADNIDVVVEATGSPAAGIRHARAAIRAGKHIVMVNVEADVLAGPLLADEARKAGVVYSLAYGDQPALTAELVDWARATGFHVVAAGKGTKYLPAYHDVTPDGVWQHYGLTAGEAQSAGMNPQMFNSFLDGTKSAIEMAAIANATGLDVPNDGLLFPPCGVDDLPHVLRPRERGGVLERSGMVEVVSSLERDGRPVFRDLRWGVYVVLEAPNDYAADCFRQYGLKTDTSGCYAAMYKPYHLIGLELNVSVLSAALRKEPTGQPRGFRGDVVAVAKKTLRAGEMLDGEGGYTVWGKVLPAATSLQLGALPIGLAHRVKLTRDVAHGEVLRWSDVAIDTADETVSVRKQMEAVFAR
ncbi:MULTISPECIES: NAD(P)H-dependent oxidoreductase [Bradyrhizobium]|jgi:predicted homoserine dehydrogenase-like protein|uniref:Gfo/Idh/MocA family oxidoreductase n=2 Tax=Bradyrhizobium TaxID=374 RepID=A0ABS5GA18_9BRAD|nr:MULTISPECIES: Gfo/Idh/MocA family oxidoreductase [Bradyrhizobium]MBR1138177.1 Gfo/Idh/MocA family oxidoreductase [Bradyrhizobium denitrificans]MDU1497845.1 Gfo/Idh/MocA family oxidoreductase [Bradyrhizobium sp.]MDU1548096.1 Gfo/Idh/MocA family oxidoreductase [Bradyrhizobium sp.]MDU1667626.1 Gfo/Idh/MocA family oxidoreductase [Bradyrhizobium sp.]MDU1805465.1 Gfo/Idh/MocA family oxidoreductase [Bradyrhizobium sp.]